MYKGVIYLLYSSLSWRSLGYSGLLSWVAVQNTLIINGLEAFVNTNPQAFVNSNVKRLRWHVCWTSCHWFLCHHVFAQQNIQKVFTVFRKTFWKLQILCTCEHSDTMIWAAKEMLVIYFLFDFRLQLFSLL